MTNGQVGKNHVYYTIFTHSDKSYECVNFKPVYSLYYYDNSEIPTLILMGPVISVKLFLIIKIHRYKIKLINIAGVFCNAQNCTTVLFDNSWFHDFTHNKWTSDV